MSLSFDLLVLSWSVRVYVRLSSHSSLLFAMIVLKCWFDFYLFQTLLTSLEVVEEALEKNLMVL